MTQSGIMEQLKEKYGLEHVIEQETIDKIQTIWIARKDLFDCMKFLKTQIERPYRMLYDLTAIDERTRCHRQGQPDSDFTLVYHLYSFDRNEFFRVKLALKGEYPSAPSISSIWANANWYECEVWDMFGIRFEGHPHLRRLLMPLWWEGHPLRKEHPARATEMDTFDIVRRDEVERDDQLQFDPRQWGMTRHGKDTDFLFLNIGPQHPGTHGLIRIILQLDEEEIVDSALDIGYHHRGAEKMGERQTWHTYIPYTDRIDYLGGVMNNLAYVSAVETLAGIDVPDRAKVIRIMMAELFRISSHLVWYGTFSQDLGQMSPIFYMFTDRERILEIVSAICGGRMHPNWFRIGGVSQDLPEGWEELVRGFLDYMPRRLRDYEKMVMKNRILKARTQGIGAYTVDEAIEWGVTGPGLRACGLEWDFRKKRPYGGYDQFEFDIPTAQNGDCFGRATVHIEEIRQSMRIIRQCTDNMPSGPYMANHPLATPPMKKRTMHDIETLITHFLNVTWGPPIPAGEALFGIEATKGSNGYYLISDGGTMSYRTRIRTPSFAHLQMLPKISRGSTIADLIAILGSVDFVLADLDR